MSLSDLASLGSFASGVAVLISLIYLAVQVRQAEKHLASLMQQGAADRANTMLLRQADPDLAAVFRKGCVGEELTETELVQFCKLFRAYLVSFQDTFLQHERRAFPDPFFQSLHLAAQDLMLTSGSRAMWRTVRHTYAPGFRAFIDQCVKGPPGSRAGEDLAPWQAALAEARDAQAWAPDGLPVLAERVEASG